MKSMKERFVAYYRVSTRQQGASGLGLEAQQEAVKRFVGERGPIIASFIEVESGKRCDRPELEKARETCILGHAKLIIAKLDRLSRDVEMIANLMKWEYGFIACDMPEADPFRMHIEASIAEEEHRKISARTKAALAAAKARGVKLGGAREGFVMSQSCRDAGNEARRRYAAERNQKILTTIESVASQRLSLRQMGDLLTSRNITPPRGSKWHPNQVRRLLQRKTPTTGEVS